LPKSLFQVPIILLSPYQKHILHCYSSIYSTLFIKSQRGMSYSI
jgi:hypothetical protein